MTLLLQRSVWHTHLMRRPLKRVCASQVACGQDFSAMSQAAADKSVAQQAIKKHENHIKPARGTGPDVYGFLPSRSTSG